MSDSHVVSGLEGVIVAETKISEVDGEKGKLVIAGIDAEKLAFSLSFEETCALLWSDSNRSSQSLQQQFARARQSAYELAESYADILKTDNAMDALRTATSLVKSGTESSISEFVKVTASLTVFAAAWARLSRGLKLVPPDEDLSNSADYLRMIIDHPPSKAEVEAIDTYLSTVSDHGMNASTFTSRVVASTGSDNISCVVAAIGALKGPLHGGAPGPVLDMLEAIGTADNAEQWIANELNSGRRIMGMGHRIYKVRDPRAAIFEKAIRRLEDSGLSATRLTLAREVEKTAETLLARRHPERPLKANVEFYTAVLLDAIKIPPDLFSATFAAGRVAGWCAHIKEQRATGRLIRPASKYIGPVPTKN